MSFNQLNEIYQGIKYPYCLQKTSFVDSIIIHEKSYGMIYICFDCDAYVGCHQGTNQSKGSLANKHLRNLRKKCHSLFDPLWQLSMKRNKLNKHEARNKAYQWLSIQLGIPRHLTHIAMFNEDICIKTISICSKYYDL